jgi:hypothetical protein
MTSDADGTDDPNPVEGPNRHRLPPPVDQKTRRRCRRLATALHTDRVQEALERDGVNPMIVLFVEARLRQAGHGQPLLGPGAGARVARGLHRVLDATAPIYPRETYTVRRRLDLEVQQR